MKRILSQLYGALGYLAFLLPIGYLAAFLADVGVPRTVNRGAGPMGPALLVDVLLLLGFGVQHSVMARPWFKRALERWVPEGLERSTYVLVSGLVLGVLFWLWRPIPLVLWDVSGTWRGALTWAAFGAGWALAVWATFALSHFHLFGVSQAAAYARGDDHPRSELRESRLYRIVRHPMTAGLLIAFWSAPRMTLGHAVFAAGMTFYCIWATVLEERDLLRRFPERFRRYRTRVPALVPIFRPSRLPGGGGLAWELILVGALAVTPFATVVGTSLEPPAPEPAEGPMETGSVTVEGSERTFVLFDPAPSAPPSATTTGASTRRSAGRAVTTAAGGIAENPDRQPQRPLVLALHGTGGDGARFRGFLGGALERAAVERGWIVAYPEAAGGVWRDCRLGAGGSPEKAGVDDVAYLRTLVGRLAETRGADPSRVYALGYSGGGHMAFRLAFEAPSLVGGVAVFGASPPTHDASGCRVEEGAVPVLMVNGTADLVNPFRGGDVITPTGVALGPVMSSEDGARYLDERNGGRAEVRLVPVEEGGHVVPGPESRFPAAAGRTSDAFSGVEAALEFFEKHGRRRADGAGEPGGRSR